MVFEDGLSLRIEYDIILGTQRFLQEVAEHRRNSMVTVVFLLCSDNVPVCMGANNGPVS